MATNPTGFLSPEQVERAVAAWLAAGFGPANAHLARALRRHLDEAAAGPRRGAAAVLVLCEEDLLAISPGAPPAEVAALLGRDWSAEMGAARAEMLRAVAVAVGRG